jgi:hypothetical protein
LFLLLLELEMVDLSIFFEKMDLRPLGVKRGTWKSSYRCFLLQLFFYSLEDPTHLFI